MKYLENIKNDQYENIVVKAPYNKYSLTNALIELSENFPNMEYVPDPDMYFTSEYIQGKSLHVKCDDDGIRIGLNNSYGLRIPTIPYNTIVKISFDTFIDKSNLVSIWIDTLYGQYTVSMNS
jgi:hypothetical protein